MTSLHDLWKLIALTSWRWTFFLRSFPLWSFPLQAEEAPKLWLPAYISDHMVLQREKHILISGQASPFAQVVADGDLFPQTTSVKADAQGFFTLRFSPMKAGGPYRFQVSSNGLQSRFSDVMVGDVWLASGQSNMEWPLDKTEGRPIPGDETSLETPMLRVFKVKRSTSPTPRGHLESHHGGLGWFAATQDFAGPLGDMSGVAYFFARKIQKELHIPIGIIVSAYGGTPIETWLTPDLLPDLPPNASAHSLAAQESQGQLLGYPTQPGVVYNAMIHPLGQLPLAGILWYQGESNVGRHQAYRDLFVKLATSWRTHWGDSNIPIYSVMLAPYRYGDDPYGLPLFWQTQYDLARRIPHAGIANSIDVGNFSDIHPTNKKPIGERLGLLALGMTYKVPGVVVGGPNPIELKIAGDELLINYPSSPQGTLNHPEGHIITGFEVAVGSGPFQKVGATVRSLHELAIKVPDGTLELRVRYGWHQNPVVNLYNTAGLPADPWGEKLVH